MSMYFTEFWNSHVIYAWQNHKEFIWHLIDICDQICQKGSYTCTVSGLTFHGHLKDTATDQQFMLVPLPEQHRHAADYVATKQSAFTEAPFTGLSGIHWCSDGL